MTTEPLIIEISALEELIGVLRDGGYTVVGPVCRDGAIVYEEITTASELPAGWTDEQDGGSYRLRRRDDSAVFGYAVGPHSWKRYLFPPQLLQWSAQRVGDEIKVHAEHSDAPRYAFVGVRSCELHAIAIQDRVFLGDAFEDDAYRSRREGAFFVAVNCGQAGGTCFCVSMNTGPGVESGFDIALTELIDDDRHVFLLEIGSERGSSIAQSITHRGASGNEVDAARRVTERTAANMGRSMDTAGLASLLQTNLEHPRWEQVAERCLSCANCTLVCPTCFCSTVEDHSDLDGQTAQRTRRWDSCFNLGFSYLHGGSIRNSTRSRYRQWLTHKLSTWHDQFGTSGCVGCGRCITWCPVGIDLTEEAAAIRQSDGDTVAT